MAFKQWSPGTKGPEVSRENIPDDHVDTQQARSMLSHCLHQNSDSTVQMLQQTLGQSSAQAKVFQFS